MIPLFGCQERAPDLESGTYAFEVVPLTSFDEIQDTLYYPFSLSVVADQGTDQEDLFFKSNGVLTFYKSYMLLSDADYFKQEIAWGALEYDPNNDFYLDQWQLAQLSGDYEIASKAKCKVFVDTHLRSRYNEDGYEHCFESELRFVFMAEEGSYEEQKEEMGTFTTRTKTSTGPWEGYNITYT